MATEVERKYLVRKLGNVNLGEGLAIDQGYLASGPPATVRVRTKGPKAFLTIKGPSRLTAEGGALTRSEFEYEIPVDEAMALLELATIRLQKTRYTLPSGLEVDIFRGRHEGLILAEFESPDAGQPPIPEGMEWEEVTADERYSNSWIARNGVPPG